MVIVWGKIIFEWSHLATRRRLPSYPFFRVFVCPTGATELFGRNLKLFRGFVLYHIELFSCQKWPIRGNWWGETGADLFSTTTGISRNKWVTTHFKYFLCIFPFVLIIRYYHQFLPIFDRPCLLGRFCESVLGAMWLRRNGRLIIEKRGGLVGFFDIVLIKFVSNFIWLSGRITHYVNNLFSII